jgi:hypothetical protein
MENRAETDAAEETAKELLSAPTDETQLVV